MYVSVPPIMHECVTKLGMQLYLAIDGGGSKTDLVLGDATRELAHATMSSCKIQRVGRDAAYEALRSGIDEVLHIASAQKEEIACCCIGISGGELPETKEFLAGAFRELLPAKKNMVFGDHVIAHAAAFHGGPGVLVISGTGSIVYGMNQRGQGMRYGGRGPQISDEGSGYWIGRRAVALAVSHDDLGEESALLREIIQEWGVQSKAELVALANEQPGPDFAALFPLIEKAGALNDDFACELLGAAGRELAKLVFPVILRLWPAGEAVRVAGAGGVFRSSQELRQSFETQLNSKRGNLEFVQEVADPVLGALLLARRG